MNRLVQEAPFWAAVALAAFSFKVGRVLRREHLPAAQEPARLLAAAESRFRRLHGNSRMWWTATEALYVQTLRNKPLNTLPRERLVAMRWHAYQHNLMRYHTPNRSLLWRIVRVSVVPALAPRPASETFLGVSLAEIELSRLAPDASQAWRWLDLAEETARLYAHDLPELGGGPNRLAGLEFLNGRIWLQRYALNHESSDLQKAVRGFWASTALDPASLASRYYLACALRAAGRRKTALRIARSLLRLPDSPREALEGPSPIYRLWARELLTNRRVSGPF